VIVIRVRTSPVQLCTVTSIQQMVDETFNQELVDRKCSQHGLVLDGDVFKLYTELTISI